ncbi:inovirus-type Gp2 protein [Burkholderia gladioli]|uniref:inovirus-type Gp2 protein n=1 Tax=Burkholderia gladioli TaxID=28095 RepID=UPI0016415B38|nr:inovirus-type Gp2 protein [Burkholderia gladioli]
MIKDGMMDNEYGDEDVWSIEPYEALMFAEQDGGIVATRIANENSIASDVSYITSVVKRLLITKRSLLRLIPIAAINPRRMNTKVVEAMSGGECFLRCLQMDLERIIDKYHGIGKFNRYFGIFYDAVMRDVPLANGSMPLATAARLEWLSFGDRDFFSDDVLELFVKYSNQAIERIRQEGSGEAFQDWLFRTQRQPSENEERLLSLIDACLSVNHHILVLRFDLGYSQFYCDRASAGEQTVSYEEMRGHRVALRRFLKRHLKNRLPPGACKGLALAIKMEFGLDKQHHFHVIVILNGNVIRKDVGITEMICNYWKSEITKGKGGACNCNQRTYQKRGIGSIRRGEHEKLKVLRETVVPYIVKADFYGKMVKPDSHRTFWSSHPPKIEAIPKGRKRVAIDRVELQ